MRRFGVLSLPLLALCFVPIGPLEAQSPVKMEITPFAGAAVFPGDLASEMLVCGVIGGICDRVQDVGMKAGVAFGAHAGARFGAWSVEGMLAFVPTSFEGTSTLGPTVSVDANLLLYGVSGLYTFPSDNPLMEVFLAGGVGAKSFSPSEGESQTNVMGNLGAGLRVWLSPTIGLRFEARDYISSFEGEGESSLRNDILLTVGLTFSPGG